LPLFNGYDLDPEPENPADYGALSSVNPSELCTADNQENIRISMHGELQNGRIACVFPGSLSSRIHLKKIHRTMEDLLSKLLQPLNSLQWILLRKRTSFRREWQIVLQNLIHDSIGGVCSDPVHTEIENRYIKAFNACLTHLENLLSTISSFFPEGYHAWNLQPESITFTGFEGAHYFTCDAKAGMLQNVSPIFEALETKESLIQRFSWTNDFYYLEIENGILTILPKGQEKRKIRFHLVEDKGDTYSSDFGKTIPFNMTSMRTYQKSNSYESVRMDFDSPSIRFEWFVGCDATPLIKMSVSLFGKESGYALIISLNGQGTLTVCTPFDKVERDFFENYKEPEPAWQPFLIAAREIGRITEFSFKDFVGFKDENLLIGWLSKNVYSYTTVQNGVGLILLRSVDFLSKPDIRGRIGDAGPYMYTPEAAMKGALDISFSLYCGNSHRFSQWKSSWLAPPVLLHSDNQDFEPLTIPFYEGRSLECTTVKPYKSNGPIDRRLLAFRFFNPETDSAPLRTNFPARSIHLDGSASEPFLGKISGKRIVTLLLSIPDMPAKKGVKNRLKLIHPKPVYSFEKRVHAPESARLAELITLKKEYEEQAETYRVLSESNTANNLRNRFEYYKAKRTALELSLSLLHNTRLTEPEDLEVRRLFSELNQCRITRRSIEFLLETLKPEV
jgi:alpha-mannosidase